MSVYADRLAADGPNMPRSIALYNGKTAPEDKAVFAGLSDQRGAAAISDLTYLEDASAFALFETLLRSNGQWFSPHPWLLTFLRGSNAGSHARDEHLGRQATHSRDKGVNP
jgi:hypothetical protein